MLPAAPGGPAAAVSTPAGGGRSTTSNRPEEKPGSGVAAAGAGATSAGRQRVCARTGRPGRCRPSATNRLTQPRTSSACTASGLAARPPRGWRRRRPPRRTAGRLLDGEDPRRSRRAHSSVEQRLHQRQGARAPPRRRRGSDRPARASNVSPGARSAGATMASRSRVRSIGGYQHRAGARAGRSIPGCEDCRRGWPSGAVSTTCSGPNVPSGRRGAASSRSPSRTSSYTGCCPGRRRPAPRTGRRGTRTGGRSRVKAVGSETRLPRCILAGREKKKKKKKKGGGSGGGRSSTTEASGGSRRRGSSPARTSDDLPAPDGPATATSGWLPEAPP